MTVKSQLRGHKIEFDGNDWIFSDTKELTALTHKNRACGNCNEYPTEDGHDACLGNLEGVMNACCGHGVIKEAYVQFLDKESIHGKTAIKYINEFKALSE